MDLTELYKMLLINFISIGYGQDDPQFWRDPYYLKRIEKTRYFHVNLYKSNSTIKFERKNRELLTMMILNTVQSFAWHNIKMIIKSMVDVYNAPVSITNMHESQYLWQKYAISKNYIEANGIHMLLMNEKNLRNILGVASVKYWCNASVYGVANCYNMSLGYKDCSLVLTHEIGHLLWLPHYSIYDSNCMAYENKCIMLEYAFRWPDSMPFPQAFSTFSVIIMQENFDRCRPNDIALGTKNVKPYDICGNGFVDPGEECDCGFEANCISSGEYDCCDMKTCKLKPNAQCSFGACCYNCKFTYNNLCRESKGECDIPEYCNGANPFCPIDRTLSDGTKCGENTNTYCYNGKCPDINKQCEMLLSKKGALYEEDCFYEYINKQEIACDTMNKTDKEYRRFCMHRTDIMCYLLPCIIHPTTGSFYEFSVELRGTEYYCLYSTPKIDASNRGYMPNGFGCGENMACVNNKCINISQTYLLCKNIQCLFGMICVMGHCVKEYSLYTKCDGVICDQNQFCNNNGECQLFTVFENYTADFVVVKRILPSYKYTPNRWKHSLAKYNGNWPWHSSYIHFLHPMFQKNFESQSDISKKIFIIKYCVLGFVMLSTIILTIYFILIKRTH